MRVAAIAVLLLGLAPASAQARPPELDRIIGSAYEGRALADLEELTDTFGARVSGSAAYQRAAEWGAAKMKAAGLTVHLETFTMLGWERGAARARTVAPVERVLTVGEYGWSSGTPPGGLRAEVIVLSDATEAGIKAKSAQIKGKIVVLEPTTFGPRSNKSLVAMMKSMTFFRDAGALAILSTGRAAGNVLHTGAPTWGDLTPIPFGILGKEDALWVARQAKKGPLTLELALEVKILGPVQVANVVGEIKGREKPGEWVLLGAHLDSWDYATGAQDNGSGVVQVIDAARAIRAAGRAPKRSIRFVLWGGEEQGMLGSDAYVRAHAAELGSCIAVLNTDNGAGHPDGWKYENRADVKAALEPIAKDILAPLGAGGVVDDISYDTDHGPFLVAGVPTLDLSVDMSGYGEVHHRAADTIDKVEAHALASGTAVVAVTAWVLAEIDKFAPRLDHQGVAEVIKADGVDLLLTQLGRF